MFVCLFVVVVVVVAEVVVIVVVCSKTLSPRSRHNRPTLPPAGRVLIQLR